MSDAIVLACRIVSPSDHGFDFPRVRVERNQSGLRPRLVFRRFLVLIACGELLFDKREALRDGFNGGFLKIVVQRGVDAEAAVHQFVFGVILQ